MTTRIAYNGITQELEEDGVRSPSGAMAPPADRFDDPPRGTFTGDGAAQLDAKRWAVMTPEAKAEAAEYVAAQERLRGAQTSEKVPSHPNTPDAETATVASPDADRYVFIREGWQNVKH